jgi:hypothetical protein
MKSSIDGFYAAYITGASGQGFALCVFKNGTIVGVDVAEIKYDGTYHDADNGFTVKLHLSYPPNTLLVQGVSTGPEVETAELDFHLPADFLSQAFVRINAKHGPVNAKFVKLRELND